ncbi:lipoprotein, putative [Brucella vulpis]|nr:lipoprotein, putative [Brucella vulpis]CUW49927.1 lipoprotein, putative [Brucella vulpis]
MKSRLTMIAIAGLLAFSTAACTTNEQRTAGYGVGGAALCVERQQVVSVEAEATDWCF